VTGGKLVGNGTKQGPTGSTAQALLNALNGAQLVSLADAANLWTMALSSAVRTADLQVPGFSTLPAEWQTTLVDLTYINGSLYGSALPSGFGAAVAAGNYAQAAAILATSSNPRFRQDAAQMQKALTGAGTC
jgi:hypothetical protein